MTTQEAVNNLAAKWRAFIIAIRQEIKMFGSKKKEPDFKFELGVTLKDEVTGFTGVVVYRTQWIHNCNVYGLQPREMKKGKPQDRIQFDEPQLTQITEEVVKPKRDTGGPNDAMQSSSRI